MTAPAPDWTNTRLVQHCLDGDERAWNVLVDRYKKLVYSIPLKYGAPHQDAADIFQSVWLELFNELPQLREAEALQGWLVRVTTHKCYHWRREQASSAGGEDGLELQPAGEQLPAEQMAELEREQLVRQAMDALPPRCRKMIDLLFFEQPPLRYAEVAERLGVAPGSIGFIRGRCLKRLRQYLEERGF
jgi:RNA polymerase sigma factor (sigma-70 family)